MGVTFYHMLMHFRKEIQYEFCKGFEFTEQNSAELDNRTVIIYTGPDDKVLGVRLYTFRYGKVVWLCEGNEHRDEFINGIISKKHQRGESLDVYLSWVGYLKDPDSYFFKIFDDIQPSINDFYLTRKLKGIFLSKKETTFDGEKYVQALLSGKPVSKNLYEKIGEYFLIRKNKKLVKYVPILFPNLMQKR